MAGGTKRRPRQRKRERALRETADEGTGLAGVLAQIQQDSATMAEQRPLKRQRTTDSEGTGSNKPALRFAESHRIQSMLKIQDLQNLLLYCLADGVGPQWVSVSHHGQIRKSVVLMVPGLEKAMFTGKIPLPQADQGPSMPIDEPQEQGDKLVYNPHTRYDDQGPDDYLPLPLEKSSLPASLAPLADLFDRAFPVKAPGDDKHPRIHSPLQAMLTSAIPKTFEEKQLEKNVKGAKPPQQSNTWVNVRTPITKFLATKEELEESDHVTHPALYLGDDGKAEIANRRQLSKTTEEFGWKDTTVVSLADGEVPFAEIEQGSITEGRTLLALDCEMCLVDGDEYALTRISVVGWDGETVLDEYVKPEKPIIDYLTQFSGITQDLLENVSTSLSDIQTRIIELLHPRTILVGHSLESDLRALKMTHPFIADTSLLYPHPRGPPLKSSLKWLSQKYLRREIQKGHGSQGHDSIEDSRAALDLVKQKCEKGPKWGSIDANLEPIFKRLARTPKHGTRSMQADLNGTSSGGYHDGKTGAIVDSAYSKRSLGSMADHYISCANNDEVIEGVRRAVYGDIDGAEIPGGGVTFTYAHLRELASFRTWSKDSRKNAEGDEPVTEPSGEELAASVDKACRDIVRIREFLPPCTLFIVYTGTGDPREMARLQDVQRTFKREYKTKKWDELSVRWTDIEEQALKAATSTARKGLGFVCLT